MKKMFAVGAIALAVGGATAPIAQAWPGGGYGGGPWYYGSCAGVDTPWGGFCDGPSVNPAGDHWHCESAPFYHGCMWKDVANVTIGWPVGLVP